jgi:hypothetical protein
MNHEAHDVPVPYIKHVSTPCRYFVNVRAAVLGTIYSFGGTIQSFGGTNGGTKLIGSSSWFSARWRSMAPPCIALNPTTNAIAATDIELPQTETPHAEGPRGASPIVGRALEQELHAKARQNRLLEIVVHQETRILERR